MQKINTGGYVFDIVDNAIKCYSCDNLAVTLRDPATTLRRRIRPVCAECAKRIDDRFAASFAHQAAMVDCQIAIIDARLTAREIVDFYGPTAAANACLVAFELENITQATRDLIAEVRAIADAEYK